VSEFSGFSPDGLTFLAELGSKDKPWFDEHRKTYQSEVVVAAKAFVEAIGEALAEGSYPLIQAVPKVNGSMAPINNDLRFSPDASPYKDHLMFKFWEGAEKKTAPTLWLRLHPTDGIGFASGTMLNDLDRWRAAIDKHGATFVAAAEQLRDQLDADLVLDGLKRVPKPFAPDHARADYLRAKVFQLRWVTPVPESIGSASFVTDCVDQLERLADLHQWQVEHLG